MLRVGAMTSSAGPPSALPIDLRLLPSFVAVAEELHFARAADRLLIAAPALSQQIRRLETQVGVRLFDRDSRTVRLTPAGEALLEEARSALHAVDRGARAARDADARRRARVTVAVDLDVPTRITQNLHRCAERLPDVDLRIVRQHQMDAMTALRGDSVDAVLGWARLADGPPLKTSRVGAAQILAILRRDHVEAARLVMPRSVFAQHPFVMFRRETSDVFDWLVTNATGRQPEQLDIEEVEALDNAMSAVLHGAVAGCGMTMAIEDAFEPNKHPDLVGIPFEPPLLHDARLMWTAANETPPIRALAQSCSE